MDIKCLMRSARRRPILFKIVYSSASTADESV